MPSTAIGVRGRTYFVTANEGDTRADWPGFQEEARVKDLKLDAAAFPDPDPATSKNELQNDELLGRLKVTSTLGDANGDGRATRRCTPSAAARSRSGTATAQLVFDSGSQLERITALALPDAFQCGHDDPAFDSRSDDKGPEPEALAIGEIDGRTYAFIGMERIGGVARLRHQLIPPHRCFWTTSTPATSAHRKAVTSGRRDCCSSRLSASPNHRPLLVVTSEISGTVSTYALDTDKPWKRPPRLGWRNSWRNALDRH